MTSASTNFEDLVLRDVTGNRPAAGVPGRLFYDETLEKWERDNGATWEDCEPAGGAGDVATDAIWDAAGDLVQGTGADAAAKLSIGTAYQVLRVNAGATAAEWAGGKTLWSEIAAGAGGIASADFTSIPATFRHLHIEGMVRGAKAAAYDDFNMTINNDSGANYDREAAAFYQTTHAIAENLGTTSWASIAQTAAASAAAGLFSYFHIRIPYYADTNIQKVVLMEFADITANSTGSIVARFETGFWRSAAAINRVTFSYAGGNIAQYSRISMYGVS